MCEGENDRIKGMLAEYNSLREERLSLARTSETIDKLFLLVFIAILAASKYLPEKNYILYLAGYFIGLSLSYKFKRDQEGMYKIGQYIKVFLENDHFGFGWQLRQELADKNNGLGKIKDIPKSQKKRLRNHLKEFYKNICGILYPTSFAMFFLALFLTHDVLFKHNNWSWSIWLPESLRICVIVLVTPVIHYVFVNKWASRKSYDYFRNEWNEKWSKVKARPDK